jgi:hypothetical protein
MPNWDTLQVEIVPFLGLILEMNPSNFLMIAQDCSAALANKTRITADL